MVEQVISSPFGRRERKQFSLMCFFLLACCVLVSHLVILKLTLYLDYSVLLPYTRIRWVLENTGLYKRWLFEA